MHVLWWTMLLEFSKQSTAKKVINKSKTPIYPSDKLTFNLKYRRIYIIPKHTGCSVKQTVWNLEAKSIVILVCVVFCRHLPHNWYLDKRQYNIQRYSSCISWHTPLRSSSPPSPLATKCGEYSEIKIPKIGNLRIAVQIYTIIPWIVLINTTVCLTLFVYKVPQMKLDSCCTERKCSSAVLLWGL